MNWTFFLSEGLLLRSTYLGSIYRFELVSLMQLPLDMPYLPCPASSGFVNFGCSNSLSCQISYSLLLTDRAVNLFMQGTCSPTLNVVKGLLDYDLEKARS